MDSRMAVGWMKEKKKTINGGFAYKGGLADIEDK